MWIAAQKRADIVVRSGPPLFEVVLTLMSPVKNTVSLQMGGAWRQVDLEPGIRRDITLVPDGVYSRRSWAYLLSVRTDNGFVPKLVELGSDDSRFLGVLLNVIARPGDQRGPALSGW